VPARRLSFAYPSLILRLSFAYPSLRRILNFELAHKSFLKKLLLFLKYLVSLQQQNLIEKINENSKKNTKMGRDNPTATHRSNGGYTLLLQGYYQRKSDCYC